MQGCGHPNKVNPLVKSLGKFVFIEVDRSSDGDLARSQGLEIQGLKSKDIFLYSLGLEGSYDLVGHKYDVFATVNYNLDIAGENNDDPFKTALFYLLPSLWRKCF